MGKQHRDRYFKYGSIWTEVFERDNYRCVICNKREDLTIDHIISIKRGGKTTYNNLRVLCRSCNTKEGHKQRDLDPKLDKVRIYMTNWRKRNPDYFTIKSREFVDTHPGYHTKDSNEYRRLYRQAII